MTVKNAVALSIYAALANFYRFTTAAELDEIRSKETSPPGLRQRPFEIDVEAALRILRTTPHSPAHRSPEDLKAAAEILERIKTSEFSGDEPTDVSENLDEYIY